MKSQLRQYLFGLILGSLLALTTGITYRLQFDARSDGGGDPTLYIHQHTSPYTNYGLNGAVANLTGNWQTRCSERVISSCRCS